MKKYKYLLAILGLAFIFGGCDYMITPRNHYVSVYNAEYDKYITSVYYKPAGYYDEYWSKNMICDFIYPNETFDMIVAEGTYDFKVFAEDDYYSYEADIYDVYVYENVEIDFCLDCDRKKENIKITKTPKKTNTAK
ncbi:MAG: hypothetical protein HY959_00245 [Ignavibacteriae bacterium]|nr:hypothetical protein [Ignavibacteriota bacterium]